MFTEAFYENRNKKLAIGLSITGVILFILLVIFDFCIYYFFEYLVLRILTFGIDYMTNIASYPFAQRGSLILPAVHIEYINFIADADRVIPDEVHPVVRYRHFLASSTTFCQLHHPISHSCPFAERLHFTSAKGQVLIVRPRQGLVRLKSTRKLYGFESGYVLVVRHN
ncbi:MAG: hypothetical protein K0Q73_9199 [Paenibacillus sp.]|jgi:hypothetical protein|nr:hypothetical protein [Paenibacillus sp.]